MASRKSKSAKSEGKAKKPSSRSNKTAKAKAVAKARQTQAKEPSKARPSGARKASKAAAVAKRKRSTSKRAQLRENDIITLVASLTAKMALSQEPAWLIDAQQGRLTPLNTAGTEFFASNTGDDIAVVLDAAMPALVTLRNRIQSGPGQDQDGAQHETLMFWTEKGVMPFDCKITPVKADKRMLFLVQSERGVESGCADFATGFDQESSKPRDDAAILREIARRIRAGTGAATVIDDVPGELPLPSAVEPDDIMAPHRTGDGKHSDSVSDTNKRAKLAHELRTPISAIIAAAEMLKDERFGELSNFRYRDYARDIFNSASHALRLIENGLSDSAETDRKPSPSPSTTQRVSDQADLNHIVRSGVATVKHLAEAAKLRVTFQPSDRDAWINCDPTAITQIVLNLLTNAVKFTDGGGTVTAQVSANLGEDVTVEVRDSGRGMSDAEIVHHLYKSSTAAPQPRPGGGFGIGLGLCRQLAEANGAQLQIVSTPKRGTVARLVFPLRSLIAV